MVSDQDTQSGSGEFVRRRFSMKQRQDQMLDELSDDRFASRSEALRVAVEDLHETLRGDSKQPLQALEERIGDLATKLEEISDQLDEQQSPKTRESPEPLTETIPVDQLNDEVYKAVSELGFSTKSDIAAESGLSELRVHETLLRLTEKELVSSLENDGETFYRPAPHSA
jgi:Arc/MetJ-type ribon-helix-helix transcriptional regulator